MTTTGDTWGALGIDVPLGHRGEHRTTCPLCSHERHKRWDKCLAVNTDKGTALCHHCGESFALKASRNAYGTPPPPKSYARPSYEPDGEGDLPPKPAAYLVSRGITPEVWRRYRVEYRRGDFAGGSAMALCFPYFRDGEVINVKWRDARKQFRMEKGAELCLYGLDDIAPDALVWVEGEFDKLACAVAGIASCVSVPNGAPPADARNLERHCSYLDADAARLEAVQRHVIATDADRPGQRLRDELVRRLGPEKCAIVQWPEGCKDANDVLVQHGPAALAACIAAARPVPIAGLLGVADLGDRIERLYDEGLKGGEHPGSDALARHYTVKPGQWSIVTGVPGHGKSALIDWIMVSLAERAGWRLAVCSPENQPLERHAAHLAELRARRPFGPGPQRRMTREELAEARDWLDGRFWFILPPDDEFTLDGVLSRAKAAVLRHGVRGVVIDPWNEIEHQRPAAMTETEYISQCLTKVRNFARRHEVHVWIVAHPTKLVKDKDGAYPVPTLYDVSGSAHWRNKADMGLVVWRDPADPDAPTQVHVQKVRFRECGEVGMVNLYYDRATGRYGDLGPMAYRDDAPPVDAWDADSEWETA
jgi:twinkle protein